MARSVAELDQERDALRAKVKRLQDAGKTVIDQRQQLEAALDYVREGDSLTVTKLDRLARSVGDLLAIVSRLEAKGVSLRVMSMSGTQSLKTSTATGRLMVDVGRHRLRRSGRAGSHAGAPA